ncbi:low-specificity L-threonine aldolase [Piscinibacter koreensis]|uniref:Low-specificity L-threonine aldolase n=1 Tax=Piscinibacter koreensis TaxID=2742824 RepID=A0A7Y6NJ46_9BURK|nr:low-specificity L-threonine aldolase [Schlegelella koreensis]NUZ04140.1 low-specificity L-threonine aldolase [Schlegelella koreensis]
MPVVDLRSDTVTRPTPAMREAMARAEVGDDVFGDDPTVNVLQERIAALLGKEAALFVPSGTQSNLLAIMSHCARGDEYIVGQRAHTYGWEGGGAAVLGSVQPQPLEHAPDGSLPLEAVEAAIKPDDAHFARTRLLCLENTIGGKVLPLDYLDAACALARRRGLASHLDGARLFNAAVALGGDAREQARRIAAPFDSVSVCFSKGLGAPVGSALVGSRELIARAHRWRKMVGGGMRQAGVIAAGALHALEHHVDRLADDHRLARRLAEGLARVPGFRVDAPQTNIVFADVQGPAAAGLIEQLKAAGVLATGLYKLRFVTHLDVDEAGIDRAIAAVAAVVGGAPAAAAPVASPAASSARVPD